MVVAALKGKYVDYTLVSTDCQEIARVSADCIILALEELGHGALNFDIVLLIQPTSSLGDATHIDDAIDLFVKKAADVVLSVFKVKHPPQWKNYISNEVSMVDFLNTSTKNKRPQDFSKLLPSKRSLIFNQIRKVCI